MPTFWLWMSGVTIDLLAATFAAIGGMWCLKKSNGFGDVRWMRRSCGGLQRARGASTVVAMGGGSKTATQCVFASFPSWYELYLMLRRRFVMPATPLSA
jgi:hypothetical protein